MSVIITNSGNCNFAYVTGLVNYHNKPDEAMKLLLTKPRDLYTKPTDLPVHRTPAHGMYLFAQGSEDPVRTRPYAPQFKAYIEAQGLGTVYEHAPVPNLQHYGKPGILFIWTIDHKACKEWWEQNVLAPFKQQQQMAADAAKVSVK